MMTTPSYNGSAIKGEQLCKTLTEVAKDLKGKADKASITGATKCKITYNSQGIVTAGADLSASDIPNLAASKITSGQFGTDRIDDDAITAAKVKDNETLPVNVSGNAGNATKWDGHAISIGEVSSNQGTISIV